MKRALVWLALVLIIAVSFCACSGGGESESDATPPSVTATSPVAINVDVNTAVTATFSESMTASSVNSSTFFLKDGNNAPVNGTITYSGTTASLIPVHLSPNTIYTATITTGVKDLSGNYMASPYSWSFRTAVNVNIVSTVSTLIFSNDPDSFPNITAAKITFETSSDCTATVEINGKHHDAGTGVRHEAYIYGTTNPLIYTIHATTSDGMESQRIEVLNADTSLMFTFHGEIDAYLDYLVPVVIKIYEKYPNRGEVINVMLLGGVDYFSLFQKQNVFSMTEKTIWELRDSFIRWYERNRSILKSAWPLLSDNQLKAASVLNAVSYLWHFGNFEMIDRVGCVQANELITEGYADSIYPDDKEPHLYWRTSVGMTDYLNSKIGCCEDHAFLTKALLEVVGFESRRVYFPGHGVTEVFIDSSWYTIDATGGVMVNATTESMVEGIKRRVFLFFTPYMKYDSVEHYSSTAYPGAPTWSIGAGLDGGITDKSQFQILLGYYDIPPYNETAQLNGF